MESTMTVLQDVLSRLRKKYNQVNNIFNLTKDMDSALQSGDEHSFAMLLGMRQNVMGLVDQVDQENMRDIGRLPQPLREKIQRTLKPSGEPLHLDNPLETDIFDVNQQVLTLLNRIVALDDSIQQKLGVPASKSK